MCVEHRNLFSLSIWLFSFAYSLVRALSLFLSLIHALFLSLSLSVSLFCVLRDLDCFFFRLFVFVIAYLWFLQHFCQCVFFLSRCLYLCFPQSSFPFLLLSNISRFNWPILHFFRHRRHFSMTFYDLFTK